MSNAHRLFSKSMIANLRAPSAGQALYRDTRLRGFGVRVGPKAMTYFAEGQVNGRTRRVTLGRADVLSVDIARKMAQSALVDMAQGTDPNEKRRVERARALLCKDAFAQFFKARSYLAATTVLGYTRSCDVYLKDWRNKPIGSITRQMVLTRHRQLSEKRGRITANNVFRHFRSVFNFAAASNDELPANPVTILTQARAWHREHRRRTIIASCDLPKWWKAVLAEPSEGRDIMLVALFTGMRRSEVLGLKWEHLDLRGCQLTLPKTKNGDPLELPLSKFLCSLLRDRAELVGQNEWVFPGRGASGHITEVKTYTTRISDSCGIAFGMHDLRRTFITIAESLDIPAYALKRLLNHRAGNDVTGGYIVMSVDRLKEPMERVATRILELAKAQEPQIQPDDAPGF
ncbi:tyrosine-type recombinase/integrase [Maricaulis sp.]|uniref:tyrosine-type recombinase/integrase n=1 Tax=Maricaulis sp. TaxID=1486257 RepID=UPI003A925084